MINVLLKNQWKIFVNTIKTQPKKNYVSYGIMIVVLAVILYFISRGVIAYGEIVTGPILSGLLSYSFLAVIGIIILIGLPQVFKQLYAATDLNLLFTMPIRTSHIFWMKYIQSFVGTPIMIMIFSLVPLFIYGVLMEASLLFYPVVIAVLLSIIVIGLSLAYLFNLILIQIVPASKANEFMTVMSIFSGLFVYLMFMIPSFANDRPLTELIFEGLPLFPTWLPVTWASNATTFAMMGSIDFIIPFILIVLLAITSVLLASTLVEKGFRTGWIRLSEGSRKKKKASVNTKKTGANLHHPIIAIGKKEWYAIKRDLREWLMFMPIGFFVIFGFIGFLTSGGELSDLQGSNEVSWPVAQVILLFMYAMFNGQIASSSIAREATSVWILRILPLSGTTISLGKLWISWLIPFVMLTTIEIIIGVFLSWTILQIISGIAMKAVITVGISGIGIYLGTIGAKYNPTNPQNRLKFSTSLILFIASYLYLIFSLIPYVLLVIPVAANEFVQEISEQAEGFIGLIATVVFTILSWKESNLIFAVVIGMIVMLIVSFGVAYIFIKTSARKIDKGIDIDIVSEAKSLGKNTGKLF
ncbi:putative ABC transporter permease subunit [Salipaludibacillus sp. HK11]|uniref:putative ABC transporter permease subunit n=1 Tax=Salipaludibacillus sp. HK11 TaxID=3394320 RepID=UPI0039FCC95B